MEFDPGKLTIGEVAKVEQLSHLPMPKWSDDDAPKGLMFAAWVFVWRRRTDPAFTWDAACELTMDECLEALGIDDEDAAEAGAPDEDPT